ncbi:MAG: CHAT domain-containing protein [Calditrichaeota bacterium]|nr:MAG: CHAT domain-containing protein [Calditrichota bacterium]
MNVSLIEFFITKNKTTIFVIDTQKPGSINEPWRISIDITEKEIRAAKALIWSFSKNPVVQQCSIDHFQQIGFRLLKPVLDYINPCDVLYIVPHKDLHYFPFYAVEIDGRTLCEQFAIIYLPNASLLQYCKANNAVRENENFLFNKILTLGVGVKEDSRVNQKKFKQEAESILEIFDTNSIDIYTGVNATKRRFIKKAEKYDLIHIASHGHFSSVAPLSSGLLLACGRNLPSLTALDNLSNHTLNADEFYRLKLKANLVVLNGCFTGRNDIRPGDELMGLTRGLFIAGVPTMMLSLWEAHHDAAICFMKCFYTELKKGYPKAIAYQAAQNHLRQQPGFSEIKYWAPFILLGDWL